MFSILNRAFSWAITSFGNKFCLKKRSMLIEALDNRFYVKFMQLEIDLFHIIRNYNHGRSSDKIWAQEGRLFRQKVVIFPSFSSVIMNFFLINWANFAY